MRLTEFGADADLVGQRVKVAWEIALEGDEGFGDIPRVRVRRKARDFEFPAENQAPFELYDSDTFPPAPGGDLAVHDLPGWELRDGDTRTVASVITVARRVENKLIEAVRRTVINTFHQTYDPITAQFKTKPLTQRVEVLDTGDLLGGLAPGTTYYYEMSCVLIPPNSDPKTYRATSAPTPVYRLNRTLYDMLPAIYQRHDVVERRALPEEEWVPEASPRSGQLRRFLDPFGAALDSLRGTAEGVRELRDVDHTDYRLLPPLAQWIGWDLSRDQTIPIQRHEIKYAPSLYRITGTIPACLIWVKRLTGWNCRVKEFFPNVFFSNDMGMLERPDDVGSRTVDTSNEELLANIGTPDDHVDYTYDTGTTDLDWYAYNVVGLYVYPNENEPAPDIARKRDKLKRNLSLFMPVNIRGVVILQAPKLVEAKVVEEFEFGE
ncbi:MAG: hypothetical protein IT331_17390 [Anaerolineae bacterium]|nr:hypothetical protein [Anaerolineae bacterium]